MVSVPNDSSNRVLQDNFNRQIAKENQQVVEDLKALKANLNIALDEVDYASFVTKMKTFL